MPALTSLRFFAAFFVLIYHAYPWHHAEFSALESSSWALRAWHTFCSHGYTAVGFFFTLSGFILASNYPAERGVALRTFYRARFARVYPVYVLGLAVALPFLVAHTLRDRSWGHAAVECGLALALLQAWFPAFWNAVNVPGWSLSVEAFFYASYPWLAGSLMRLASTAARTHLALAVLYALALVAPALATWCFGLAPGDTSIAANVVRYSPPLALPEFAFGVVLGHARARGFDQPRLVARLLVPALGLLACSLFSAALPYYLLHNGALLPLFAVVILRCSRGQDVPALLRHPWAQLLGEASYALYVLHLSIWVYLKIVIERSGHDPAAPWVFPVVAIFAVAASLMTLVWIERPARAWLHPKPL